MNINELFDHYVNAPVDMRGHMWTLAGLGHGKDVVEIGFREGVSATAFLYGGAKRVVSYDIDKNCVAHSEKFAGLPHKLVIADSSRGPFGDPCDVLMIDGNHSYDAVLLDFLKWEVVVRVDGHIVLHDSHSRKWPGVAQAIKEMTARSEWQVIHEFPHCHGLTVMARRA